MERRSAANAEPLSIVSSNGRLRGFALVRSTLLRRVSSSKSWRGGGGTNRRMLSNRVGRLRWSLRKISEKESLEIVA